MRSPELIAHRGYTLKYPENTQEAFKAAINAGTRFIECDVQLSGDGVPVLFHDQNLQRICKQPGAIHEYTWQNLQEFRASDPGRFGNTFSHVSIATLESFINMLAANPGVNAFIELKTISLDHFGIEFVLGTILPHLTGLEKRIILISYNLDSLIKAREAGWKQVGAVIDDWQETKIDDLQQLKPQYLFCAIKGLPAQGNIAYPGAKIAVFEVADPGIALNLSNRGVDMIETFAIDEMLTGLRQGRKNE
jgi:glycerophosphoryl diester phosphodiesterase